MTILFAEDICDDCLNGFDDSDSTRVCASSGTESESEVEPDGQSQAEGKQKLMMMFNLSGKVDQLLT